MATPTDIINQAYLKEIPDIQPGDTIRVHQKIKETNRERIQVFEGIVLGRKHGKGINATITVRKISQNVAVERIFPLHAPFIQKIEVVKRAKVRRAKLYYLRDAKGKKGRLKAKAMGVAVEEPKDAPTAEEPETETTEETAVPEAAEENQEQASGEPQEETAEKKDA